MKPFVSGRVLVAGATGCLGRSLVPTLRRRGYFVRALGRDPIRLAHMAADDLVLADAFTGAGLSAACAGMDAVFSCIGASVHLSPSAGRLPFTTVDVQANTNLIQAAKHAGVPRFAYVSLVASESMRGLDYVEGHERVVRYLRQSGLDYTIIRPTGVFSAFEQMLHIAARGPMPEISGGTARSNPIDDRDLAEACAESLRIGGDEYAIGGPDVLSRREMGALAFAALGRRERYGPVPGWAFRAAGYVSRSFQPRVGHVLAFYAALGENDLIAPSHGARTLGTYFSERAAVLFPRSRAPTAASVDH